MDPTIRLRLATRIHFALRRNYGEDVEVRTLLRGLLHYHLGSHRLRTREVMHSVQRLVVIPADHVPAGVEADLPVRSQAAPGDVRSALPATAPEAPESVAALIADLDRVIVPGLTSCSASSDCPSGQTCQSDLSCK